MKESTACPAVLHIAPVAVLPSGVVEVLTGLTQELLRRGCEVGILASTPWHPDTKERFTAMGAACYGGAEGGGWRQMLARPRLSTLVGDLLRYDVVHLHNVWVPGNAALVGPLRQSGLPYLVSPHGGLMPAALHHHAWRKRLFLSTVLRNLIPQAALIHALNSAEEQAIASVYPGVPTRVLPSGVPPLLLESAERVKQEKIDHEAWAAGDLDPCRLRLLYLGRLDVRYKGLDVLLQAVDLCRAPLAASGARLVLAGPFNSDADEQVVRHLMEGMEPLVRLWPPVYGEEKIRLMASCDVFLYPSRSEGLPVSVLEALALGKPCVVTPGSNMADVVQRADAGFASDFSMEALAEVLVRVARTPLENLRTIGARGARWARENATWQVLGEKYEDMYREAIARSRQRRGEVG
mgnify:CR=1 FL=1